MNSLLAPSGIIQPYPYAVLAQAIRDAAGIPSTETVGPRIATGLTGVALVDEVGVSTVIAAESTLVTYLGTLTSTGSGSGTAGDPYLIENVRYNNSETRPRAFEFTSSDTYVIKFVNCWFSGYDISCVRATGATNITIIAENCLFTYDDTTGDPSDTATSQVSVSGGDAVININACACTSSGISFFRALGTYTGTTTLTDCLIDDSGAAWTAATTSAVQQSGTGLDTIIMQNCTVDGSTNTTLTYGYFLASSHNVVGTFNIYNCLFNATARAAAGTGVQVSSAGTIAHTGNIKYNRFTNQVRESINMVTCDGMTIEYNDFQDSALDFKHVHLNGSAGYDIDNVQINNNEAASTGGTSAECFYFYRTLGVICEYNYVSTCSNDCYEFVEPQPGGICRHNVGNAPETDGAVCDMFNEHATNAGALTIHNIFGTSAGVGVSLDGRTTGDTVSAIFVDTTSGTLPIVELRNTGTAPANNTIMSPMGANALAGSGVNVDTSGVMGANNTFNGVALT